MKVMRIAVVAGALVGLVAATVHAGLFNASISGKQTKLDQTTQLVTSKSFSSKTILGTNKTEKLVLDSSTGALNLVDECGNFITNIVTVISATVTVADANSNEVDFVLLSLNGTGDTNGTAVVTISNGKTFKAIENFQVTDNQSITVGKITTSSVFKPASTCPQ